MSFRKTIFAFLFFNLCVSPVFAGPEVTAFKKDVAALMAEQAKTPNRIIHYADKDGGKLAKTVMNPARASKIVAECRAEGGGATVLNALNDLIKQYNPVAINYGKAFKLVPGEYDSEYLDSFETTYMILIGTLNYLQTLKVEQIEGDKARKMAESMNAIMKPLPRQLTLHLQAVINAGKFSPSYRSQAQARLDHMKSYVDSSLPKEAAPAAASKSAPRQPART